MIEKRIKYEYGQLVKNRPNGKRPGYRGGGGQAGGTGDMGGGSGGTADGPGDTGGEGGNNPSDGSDSQNGGNNNNNNNDGGSNKPNIGQVTGPVSPPNICLLYTSPSPRD